MSQVEWNHGSSCCPEKEPCDCISVKLNLIFLDIRVEFPYFSPSHSVDKESWCREFFLLYYHSVLLNNQLIICSLIVNFYVLFCLLRHFTETCKFLQRCSLFD